MSKLIDLKQALAQSMAVPEYQVDSLMGRVTPVILIEDLVARTRPLERPCAAGTQVTAAAAQYSQFQVFNPAGSGVIAFVDALYWGTTGTAAAVAGFYDTALPSAAVARFVDRRVAGANPSCLARWDDGASKVVGAAANLMNFRFNAATTDIPIMQLPAPAVLEEGQGFCMELTAVNIGLIATLFWRERPKTQED